MNFSRTLLLLVFLIGSNQLHAQIQELNNYKYVIVNDQFSFVKKPDQYKTSSLTKFLMEKTGFEAYIEGEDLPYEIQSNRCKTLFVDVVDDSGMLSTKSKIQFRDCNNKLVYETKEGRSKIKEYERAYYDAINKSYRSLEGFQYKFVGDTNVPNKITVAQTTTPIVVTQSVSANTTSSVKKEDAITSTKTVYAQPVENGFQLVDTTPKVVYIVQKTSTPNVFILKNKNGILSKKNESWLVEYYENGVLKLETITIKF